MDDSKYPIHWHFALGAAFLRLKTLVWRFDAETEARGRAFAGVQEPNELIRIVDSFLTNEAEHLYQGDIRNLKEMREVLEKVILPMYQTGQETARQLWGKASPEEQIQLEQTEQEDFRNLARMKAPQDVTPSEKSWFVEGFCRQWQNEWMDYYRRQYENENNVDG